MTKAEKLVVKARFMPGNWYDDREHYTRIVFDGKKYIVVSSGNVADYMTPEEAAAALTHQWELEDQKCTSTS